MDIFVIISESISIEILNEKTYISVLSTFHIFSIDYDKQSLNQLLAFTS